jgi:hypothetical protein
MDYDYLQPNMVSAPVVAAALSPVTLAAAFSASSCLNPVVTLDSTPAIAYLAHLTPPGPPPGVCSLDAGMPSAAASITFDMPFNAYSANAVANGRAFAEAVAPLIRHYPSELVVTSASAATWPVAGTSVTFQVALEAGVRDRVLPALVTLFANSSTSPALPKLLSALTCAGLPVTAAYFGSHAPSPPPPVGTFTGVAQAQQIAFDIPFNVWQTRSPAYSPAVQSAVADVLGLNRADVWVTEVRPGSHGSTIVSFNIATVSSSSDLSPEGQPMPHEVVAFAALFGSGNGFTTLTGDQATAVFTAALHKYGLPASGVFYFDKTLASGRRLQQYAAQNPEAVMATHTPKAPCKQSVGTTSHEQSMTVDIGFAAWKNNSVVYSSAFAHALAPLLGSGAALRASDIVLTAVADAKAGKTVLFFAAVLSGTVSDADLTRMVGALFSGNALAAAFACAGLPVTTVTLGNTLPSPPPPLAEFEALVQDQQIASDIPFTTWQARTYAFSPAVESAIAEALGLTASDVWVTEVRAGAAGGSLVTFDIASPATESSSDGHGYVVPKPVQSFASLFGDGNGFTTSAGDVARPELLALLRKYGLPASSAYYVQQPSASPARRLMQLLPSGRQRKMLA